MSTENTNPSTEPTKHYKEAHYIGRCWRKGCATVVRITIPMVGIERKLTSGHGIYRHEYKAIEWRSNDTSWNGPYDSGICCTHHRVSLRWKLINGVVSDKHVCDARCINAIGPNCECSCGGKNHGAGYSGEKLFNFTTEDLQS